MVDLRNLRAARASADRDFPVGLDELDALFEIEDAAVLFLEAFDFWNDERSHQTDGGLALLERLSQYHDRLYAALTTSN